MTSETTNTATKAEALLAKAAKAPRATKVSSVGNPESVKTTKTAKVPKVTEIKMCLCHCGESTTNQFRQGHDARGKGQLIRHMAANGGTLAGFQNDELVAYALGGGFSGRFVGVATKAKTVRAPRTKKIAA